MDHSKEHGKSSSSQAADNSSSRGPSPSRPVAAAAAAATPGQSSSTNGKVFDGGKPARRRSPLPPRKMDRNGGEKLNATALTVASSSLTLPATPSIHSLIHSSNDILPSHSSSPLPPNNAFHGDVFASTKLPVGLNDEVHQQSLMSEHEHDVTCLPTGADSHSAYNDSVDGANANFSTFPGTPEFHKVRLAMEQIHTKVNKTRELIREEQLARDGNVNEYLRLASQADKQQQIRLKAVFEKKNTKSAQQMAHFQRKLESYQRRLRTLENQGLQGVQGHRAPKQVLRDVGIGIKTVMSKPREFAHLIRNKFGSADNINHLGRNGDSTPMTSAPEDYSLTAPSASTSAGTPAAASASTTAASTSAPPPSSSMAAGNSNSLPGHGSQQVMSGVIHAASQGSGGGKYTSEEGSECGSSVTSESMPGGLHMSPRHNAVAASLGLSLGLDSFFQELQERREEVDRIREEMEHVKQHVQQEVSFLSAALQEERFRVERLEEQINDLTELHQNEVENLKQNIADMEEKVQYQSEERLRDIHDLLESCHTRISKVEHQAQHQQHVNLEGIENSNARAVLVKLINMALTLLQLVLVVVSTAANIISPFLKTRLRVLSTCILALLFAFVLKQWPDLVDLGSHLIQHYKTALTSLKNHTDT